MIILFLFLPLLIALLTANLIRLIYLYEYHIVLKSEKYYISSNKVLRKTKIAFYLITMLGMGLLIILDFESANSIYEYILTFFAFLICFIGVIFYLLEMLHMTKYRKYNIYHTSETYYFDVKKRLKKLNLSNTVSLEGYFIERIKIKGTAEENHQEILRELLDQDGLIKLPNEADNIKLLSNNKRKLQLYVLSFIFLITLVTLNITLLVQELS